MITKLCSRCNEVKPAAEFPLMARSRDGLSSHCRKCKYEVSKEWKGRNPAYQEQAREERHGQYDPIAYSRAICAHVEAYTDRAIRRFEKHTGREAPPHMTALRDVARSFVAEHPEKVERQCVYCEEPLEKSGRGNRLCTACSKEATRARGRQKYRARHEMKPPRPVQMTKKRRKELIVEGRALERKMRADLAYLYRLHGMKWQDISDKLGLSGPGHAHSLVHGGDGRKYAPARDLEDV